MKDFGDYIGTRWVAGAQGPDEFDCMGFFRHIQKEHFGVEVPQIIAPDYNDPACLVSLFGAHPERTRWTRTTVPRHGSAVIVRKPLHIGVWLDVDGGGVLHCVRGVGVIFTRSAAWAVSGFGRCEYFNLATPE